jgi:hypothetical protein
MPQEGFPSQDPEQLARVLASNAYHDQKAEEAKRNADEAAAEAARQTQEQRLEKWFTGSQANAKDIRKYLDSRPYEDEEGIHGPSGKVVEPVDAGTAGRKMRVPNQWGNRYFEGQRSERYEQSHDNPAELSAYRLFDRFVEAEIDGNKTFIEDYGKILAEKLDDRNVTPFELADLLADAENDSEVKGSGVSQTTKLLNAAIDDRVREFHNRNLGKVKGSHEMHDADGKLRTVSAMEYGAMRTEAYRARIMNEKEDYLAVLRESRAQRTEAEHTAQSSRKQESAADEAKKQSGEDELDDYIPDWVRVKNNNEDDIPDQHDEEEPKDDGATTTKLPKIEEHISRESDDQEPNSGDAGSEAEPSNEADLDDNAEYVRAVVRAMRRVRALQAEAGKNDPPAPEFDGEKLDELLDRLFPVTAKAEGGKQPAGEGKKKESLKRRAKQVGQTLLRNMNILSSEVQGRPENLPAESAQETETEETQSEHLQRDPRFTTDLVDTLKGTAHLAGDAVEITEYLGSEQTEDTVRHFMEYKDAEGNHKFTTLDQFLWMDLPVERRRELEEAGVNPYDLVAGTDPILKPNT